MESGAADLRATVDGEAMCRAAEKCPGLKAISGFALKKTQ